MIQPTLGIPYASRRLRLFIQVVRYATLMEACQTHGIHPSTLTMQLKRLESDLGGPLLIRASRGRQVKLTGLGRDVVEAVEVWAQTLAEQPGKPGPDRSGALHGQGAGARASSL
ncbi:helix-turn-helix domain-containing protein [Streptomyces nigra]|uniref:helix-turn-helix domain-containing protein n=1 Tax=Streptomyces nigra TaxID=1827580 RepID=UPI0036A9B14B